jgi:hypothetical protein
MLVTNDSPLRILPHPFSKKQVLVFDGIRYAAEMADIAHSRLKTTLFEITRTRNSGWVSCRDIAYALLDAWAVVDSVNRMRDLLAQGGHGVKQDVWYELFERTTRPADGLRNRLQHIEGEVIKLATKSGQLWGYLTWVVPPGLDVNPGWYALVPGSLYAGDQYRVVSEIGRTITKGDLGVVKLKAYGEELDFDKVTKAVAECVSSLEERIAAGEVRLDKPEATGRRVGDTVIYMVPEIVVSVGNQNI